jgi:hypothetical protein
MNTTSPKAIAQHCLSRVNFLLMVIAVLVFQISVAHGQAPFRDGEDNGTVLLAKTGGYFQFDVADPSVRFGYLRDTPSNWVFGFEASGKLTGNKAPLLTQSRVAPDAKVGFSIGRKYVFANKFDLTDPNVQKQLEAIRQEAVDNGLERNDDLGEYLHMMPYDRLTLQLSYAYKQYRLFDEAATFDNQVFKKGFHNPSAALTYSGLLTGTNFLGVSLGVGRSNNSDDLTEVDVRDINTFSADDTVREVVRTREVLRGDFKQSTSVFLNTDYVWYPRKGFSRIGFDFYTRSVFTGIDKGFRPGLGVFLSEKGSPTKVLGGFTISYDDGKPSMALVVGFSF